MNIKKGDIIKLGNHYLGCGSSMDSDFVEKIFECVGRNVKVILTDPPYGVAYVEGKKHMSKLGAGEDVKIIANDQLQTEDEYKKFTEQWMTPIKNHMESYNAMYIFNSDLMYRALRNGIEGAGWYYSQMIIWVKNNIVVRRKDYLPQHELIAYGWIGRHKLQRSKSKSVLFYPKPVKSKLHPTMKPVGLLRMILPDNTRINDVVYDPFLGSGSTLIACEHMQRVCVGIELEIEYCNRIVERWQKLTGKKAEKYEPKTR